MVLTVLSKAFGILPTNEHSKLSMPLLVYSVGLLLMAGYLVGSNLNPGAWKDVVLSKCFLDNTSLFLRASTWVFHLRAMCNGDTFALDLLRTKKWIVEPTVLVLISTSFPAYDNFVFNASMGYLWIPGSVTRGVTRTVQYLILLQFIGSVDQLSDFFDYRISSNFDDSIAVQRNILEKARKLNDFFTMQLLSSTASIFVTLCAESYYLLSIILSKPSQFKENMYNFIQGIVWFFLACYWLMRLVCSCEKFDQKMDKFNDQIYNSLKKYDHLTVNKKLQLYAIKRPTVVFTAYRFFPIGYPLITSVIAAVATYLVILLQFSE